MADIEVQESNRSQYLLGQVSGEMAKYCEKCIVLEDQLLILLEELKTSKVIINLLLKDIEIKDDNLEKCMVKTRREQIYGKYPSWSEVVKGIKEPLTCM
jgi:hypothetical protein